MGAFAENPETVQVGYHGITHYLLWICGFRSICYWMRCVEGLGKGVPLLVDFVIQICGADHSAGIYFQPVLGSSWCMACFLGGRSIDSYI